MIAKNDSKSRCRAQIACSVESMDASSVEKIEIELDLWKRASLPIVDTSTAGRWPGGSPLEPLHDEEADSRKQVQSRISSSTKEQIHHSTNELQPF